MTEDADSNITGARKLLSLLAPIRQWKSRWRKLMVAMLITLAVAVPAAIAAFLLTGVAFHFLGFTVLGTILSSAIAVAVVIVLPAITISYCTYGSEQEQWKWDWRSIGKWIPVTTGIPLICIAVFIVGSFIVEKGMTAEYSVFIVKVLSESEAVNDQRSPVKLIQFRPAAADKKHRITLRFNSSYPFPQTAESRKWGTFYPHSGIFTPNAELRLMTASDSIIKSTDWLEGGLNYYMTLEFTPRNRDDYSIDFIGPPKGFAEYKLTIEAQGIE